MEKVAERTIALRAADGQPISVRDFGPEDAEKTIVLVHGYGEHSGRYRERIQTMVAQGYRVLAPDMRGHGRSGGQRGYVKRYTQYVEDLHLTMDQVATDPDHTYIIGHSNGGLIVLSYMCSGTKRVRAAAVTCPLLGLALQPPRWKEIAGSVLGRIAPMVSLPGEIDPKDLSHDPAVVAAYESDPLNHHVVNARYYVEALAAIDRCFALTHAPERPILVMQGGDDKVVSPAAAQRWAEHAPNADFEMVDGAYHELFFEPEGQSYVDRVLDWFATHSS